MFIKIDKNRSNTDNPIEETKNLLKTNKNIVICTVLENTSQVIELERLLNDMGLEYETKKFQDSFQITTLKGILQKDLRTNNHYLVYLDKNYIGTMNKFGEELMLEYLEDLLNSAFIPSQLILVNQGTLLIKHQSKSYNMVKALEELGVSVFICSKSAKHFQIKPSIGQMISLEEIIRLQLKAEKIIKI